MIKLSKREKTMIYIMFIVIICGCSFMIISRLYKSYQKQSQAFEDRNTDLMVLEAQMSSAGLTSDSIEDLKTYYDEHKDVFSGYQTEDYIEQYIMGQTSACGLDIASTTFAVATPVEDPNATTEATTEEVATEGNTDLGDGLSLDDGTGSGETTEGETTEAPSEETTTEADGTVVVTDNVADISYITTTVSLELKGSYANFCNFLDKVAETTDLKIASYTVYNGDGDIAFSLAGEEGYTYYVELNYTMTNVKSEN